MTSAVPGPVAAGPGAAAMDVAAVERMLATVYRLAADEFTGRRTGTPGGRAAAAWLADELRRVGAAVSVDEFPVTGAVKDLYRTPLLHWSNDLGTWRLVHRRDFCEHLASAAAPQPRTGRLAQPGEADVRGAWLLGDELSANRVERAAAAGALGLLVPRGTDEAGWMPKMIAATARVALPVLAVRADVHRQMHAFAAGTGAVTASVPLRTVDVTGANVLGVLRDGEPRGLSVLLTAHFDGVGDDPEVRLPAAADNASGVAVVLEAARQLRTGLDPRVGLAVALLDAEEAGAHGSAHHAARVPAGTFVINVDGAAGLGEAAAVEAGGPAHPLLAAVDRAGRQVEIPLRAGAMPSDNRRYAAAGIPAIGIGMGVPGYQTPAETPDRVQHGTLLAAARLVVATVQHLASARRQRQVWPHGAHTG
jgi:aminopeptidase YwaD